MGIQKVLAAGGHRTLAGLPVLSVLMLEVGVKLCLWWLDLSVVVRGV